MHELETNSLFDTVHMVSRSNEGLLPTFSSQVNQVELCGSGFTSNDRGLAGDSIQRNVPRESMLLTS